MSKPNFMDNMYVEDLNKLYNETGFMTLVEDGHAVCSFNENRYQKAYEVLNDYRKERYRNLTLAEICE